MPSVTGWFVVLDMSTYCIACAPTASDARRLWGAGPFDSDDLIKVGEVDADWAAAYEATCRACGRSL